MGRAHPPPRILRGGVPRRALRRAHARRQGRPGSPEPDRARDRRRDPRRVLRGGRRHRNHEHLHGDVDRPGRLRARRCGGRDEPRGRAPRARRRRRLDRTNTGQAALRRGLGRPAQCHALPLAEGRRRGIPGRDVRRGAVRLRGADPRAARRRRRPPPDRDDLRHAERQGGDRCRASSCARTAAVALVHRDRPQRTQSLGPDLRRVLDLRRACRAVHRGGELLARRNGDAAVSRGSRGHRVDVRLLPSERRAPERARPPRRASGGHEPLPEGVRGGRPRQPRRRLLRDHTGAHPCDRPSCGGAAAAPCPVPRHQATLLRPRSVRDRPRHRVRRRGRADERDRVGAFSPADRGERLPGCRRRRARAGARRGESARREHGRRPARRRAGDDDLSQSPCHRARGCPSADHGRQLALLRARGRPSLPAGQGRRQLDLAEGGRGAVPRAGADDSPVRRRRRGHGLRRARAGGHGRAQGRRFSAARTTS